MKAIMLMFDSLNRHMLPPYGCDWTHAPNFRRLAERTVTFDHCWIGSMPCMPARRELHTGRSNFLHRSWGPLEPFDDSMPELLKQNGVYAHLVTDHYHYFEDGGATYHQRYNSFEFSRGQEGDFWKGEVADPQMPDTTRLPAKEAVKDRSLRQDWINRKYMKREEDFPQAVTMQNGLSFIRRNAKEDNWFLQIETFDPHEPFYAPETYRNIYAEKKYDKPFDWPPNREVRETESEVQQCRFEYAALLSMSDHWLGKLLDLMDELDLWKDTMLVVNTDHGFLLSEHEYWGKSTHYYNEVARIPLFIWDPRCGKKRERRNSLVQMIDMAPTLLQYFGLSIPKDMTGHSLHDTIKGDIPVRNATLFGNHGGHVNCTDGRYVYMRAPVHTKHPELYNYTLMPTHMKKRFSIAELKTMQLADPFSFTKRLKTMKIKSLPKRDNESMDTRLYDLQQDPDQCQPVADQSIENRMASTMKRLMAEQDAPLEQYKRMGL